MLRRWMLAGAGAGLAAASAALSLPRAEPAKKTYLVTGCSAGLGLELVRQLAARGDRVYATCRTPAASASGVDELSQVAGDVVLVQGVDVTSDSVGETLKAALEAYNGSHAKSRAQTVQKLRVLDNPFTVDGGELTPTMKVKRAFVIKAFAAVHGKRIVKHS